MAVTDDLPAIAERADRERDAVHDFFEHSRVVWRSFQILVDDGDSMAAENRATGTRIDQEGLARLAPQYTREYLATITFRQFVSALEGVMRTWRWIALGGAVAAALLIWRLWPWEPRFGESCYGRIKEGMTEREVEAVLGCPAGDYRRARPVYHVLRDGSGIESDQGEAWAFQQRGGLRRRWFGDTSFIIVAFSEDGRVIGCSRWERGAGEPSWFQVISNWASSLCQSPSPPSAH